MRNKQRINNPKLNNPTLNNTFAELDSLFKKIIISHITVREIRRKKGDKCKSTMRIHFVPFCEKYRRNLHVSHLPKHKKILDEKKVNEKCVICHNNFKLGEYSRELPVCQHFYHKKCIDKWLSVDKNMKCPVCRISYSK